VLRKALPELMKGLGVPWLGHAAMQWQQLERWGMHNMTYGSGRRAALTLARPVLAFGLAVGGALAGRAVAARLGRARRPSGERE
jgi:hypothetical protein